MNDKCMFEGCERDTYGGSRGFCIKHYSAWHQRVKRGKTTWKELEEQGLCKKKLTQEEKNINQMHPHRSYKKKN